MKNNFITKIIGATLAFAMMIGGAVGINAAKQAKEVNADGEEWATATDTYERVNSISAGDKIIIVAANYGKAMGSQGSNLRNAAAVTKNQSGTELTIPADNSVAIFTVGEETFNTATCYTFFDGGGYLNDNSQSKIGSSGSNQNYLTTVSSLDTTGGKTHWAVSFNDGIASVVAKGQRLGTGRYTMSYNYNNGSDRFSCYTGIQGTGQSSGQLSIFKKVASTSVVDSVDASVKSGTYYTGSRLSASDFNVTVHWTEGKEDTHPTSNFTWTVNGVDNGTLVEGNNAVVITFQNVSSAPFNVVGTTIHVSNVTVAESEISLEVGDTFTLHVSKEPADAVENITWSSDDESVATVDDAGVVTAVSNGEATITATAGSYSDSCTINVLNLLGATLHLNNDDELVSASEEALVWNVEGKFSMRVDKENATTAANNFCPSHGDSSTRFYKDSVVTLTPSPVGVNGVKAIFNATTENYATTFASSTFNNGSAIANGTAVTVSIVSGDQPLIITISGTCGFSSVNFRYEEVAVNNPEPYLTLAESIKTISGHETATPQAATANFVFSDIYNADTNFTSTSIGQLTISCDKGSGNAPKYYTNGSALRVYNHNTLVFSATGNVTQITFTLSSGSISNLTPSTGSFEDNVWTGFSQSVSFEVSDTTRITSVAVNYQSVTTSVDNVCLRFGGVIPVSTWIEINTNWTITDFGVMFARGSMLTARSLDSLEEVFRNDSADVAMVHRGSVGTPNANGDDYIFTARLNLEEADYDEVFYAAPFIVAGGEYYFLQEMHYSVRTLAEECLTSGESSLSQAALTILKGNN